jgi:hypothetical protein
MSTIAVAWWWMLVALGCVALTGSVCGWVAYNWGWSHAAEDVHGGQHARRPRLPSDFGPPVPDALAPIARLELLPAPVTQPVDHFREPDPVVFGGRSSVLFEVPRDFGRCEPDEKPDLRQADKPGAYLTAEALSSAMDSLWVKVEPKADDPSITTWTREQAEELDRQIKAMIADTDVFIANLSADPGHGH